ncbi:UPF0687 protein C20orf27-like [Homarus americanus]|uniref:UPF0687 protein C20orf27-like n=1 Tax=Homarus americanus TaxID=6706 RepID=UPI001C46A863|nr:UPF0687 protein C20orf27-like [Homarus americanus]XP_042242365.1 UPF0687 protein C20orf27-like [Homarus americanus]XP_042242366.1 UPF0687 protein C20orf27-like [Homarus americanus]XP_042242367.1 UPF0687 protein C20orf27-like [Homarus americanus]XP_042242368.1 UPF0687 protein C20orf27-like [Homarus americanus]
MPIILADSTKMTTEDKDPNHDANHHVHFSEDTDQMGNTAIVIKEKSAGNEYEAHVGFLQLHHRYLITVRLPLKDASDGYQVGQIQGVYCHAQRLQEVEDGLEVTLELLAHKEKLLREKIILLRPTGSELKLTVLARVLGRGKGTPMLRDGIHCISVEPDDDSESTDWQGFT